jgi:hypothetical protein
MERRESRVVYPRVARDGVTWWNDIVEERGLGCNHGKEGCSGKEAIKGI